MMGKSMVKLARGSGGAPSELKPNRPEAPAEALPDPKAGGGPDRPAGKAGRPGFAHFRGKATPPKWTAASIAAEMEAIFDRAQAERRNLTLEEEEEYLKLARLRSLAEELEEEPEEE